ncbi:VOC family protein [Paenibacillus nasutitermitis]|uniref:VOC family protein n=1 Tax=Paenibacillus nasutitermitis TaxID=1652958 RepID=A0A916YTB5_9BACL|nr:VOC family protein [Paenibacillus nasutitermitis]GGD60760.1 VOC family protein [Paenibacillus nasutitermitis]
MEVQLTPFIMLDGSAREAIAFYEDALDAKVVFKQTFGEAPGEAGQEVPEQAKERLAHSILKIGGADLFVADTDPGVQYAAGKQVNICVSVADRELARKYFEALKDGGQVDLPLQEIHFSPAYGMVTDKFGVTFQIFTKRA